jgi:hypothetical protein
LKLHAYQKVVKHGSHSAQHTTGIHEKGAESLNDVLSMKSDGTSNSREMIEEKWKELGEISVMEAKKEFLLTLIALAPYWKWEQFVH